MGMMLWTLAGRYDTRSSRVCSVLHSLPTEPAWTQNFEIMSVSRSATCSEAHAPLAMDGLTHVSREAERKVAMLPNCLGRRSFGPQPALAAVSTSPDVLST